MLFFMLLIQIALSGGFFLLNNNNYNYHTKLYSRLFEREGKLYERDDLLLEKRLVLNSTIDTEIIDEVYILYYTSKLYNLMRLSPDSVIESLQSGWDPHDFVYYYY